MSMIYNDINVDPLSTPEICKQYLLESELYPSPPIPDEHQFIGGLMEEIENFENNTMVSPNDVLGYRLEAAVDGIQNMTQNMGQNAYPQYQPYNDNGYSSSSSFPASPESMHVNYDNCSNTMTLTNFNTNFSAASPAESHFSSDSAVSFYNLDQPIKQEMPDFPAVIEEINQSNSCQPTMVGQQQQSIQYQYNIVPQQQPQQQQYQMLEPAYGAYQQQPEFLAQVPTTVTNMQQVSSAVYTQQPMLPQGNMTILTVPQAVGQQQSQQQTAQQHVQQPTPVASRKRTSTGAFAPTSESTSAPAITAGPSGTKKTRLTKRQKQQLMDKQVDEYTQKNKDLRNQIELLERKVQFCTQFLQKYVSPIVQSRSNTWTPDLEAM